MLMILVRNPNDNNWHRDVRDVRDLACQELPRKLVEGKMMLFSIKEAAGGTPQERKALEDILQAITTVIIEWL